MLILKRGASGCKLGLAHNLDLNTLGTEIIEDQLIARGTLGVNTASKTDGNVGLLFTLGKRSIVGEELTQVGVDLELVGVGVGALGLAQLIDSLAADLEVLLKGGANMD